MTPIPKKIWKLLTSQEQFDMAAQEIIAATGIGSELFRKWEQERKELIKKYAATVRAKSKLPTSQKKRSGK